MEKRDKFITSMMAELQGYRCVREGRGGGRGEVTGGEEGEREGVGEAGGKGGEAGAEMAKRKKSITSMMAELQGCR